MKFDDIYKIMDDYGYNKDFFTIDLFGYRSEPTSSYGRNAIFVAKKGEDIYNIYFFDDMGFRSRYALGISESAACEYIVEFLDMLKMSEENAKKYR